MTEKNIPAINIITATPEHLPAIAALERASFSQPWSVESLAGMFANPNAYILAAMDAAVLAGYLFTLEIAGESCVTNLAVEPTYRERGIGAALLCAALSGAQERGCECVTLEVREGNRAAVRLYEKHGFQTVGRRKAYYHAPVEDALLMTRYFSGGGDYQPASII